MIEFLSNMTVVLQHRPAASHVDNDGIQRLIFKRGHVLFHQPQSRLRSTAVIMNCSAAALTSRNHNVTTIGLKNSRCGPVHMAKHRVRYAANEQSDSGTARPLSLQEFGQLGQRSLQRWQLRLHSLQPLRQKFIQPYLVHESIQPQSLHPTCWSQCEFHAVTIGEQTVHNPAMKPIGLMSHLRLTSLRGTGSSGGRHLMHLNSKRFNQSTVLNTARTSRFATATVQTQIQMMPHFVGQIEPSIDHGSHQINASSRAVIFIARFDIRWTRRRTKAAVHAVQKSIIRNRLPDHRQ